MYSHSKIQYYLQEHHSDLELVKFYFFESIFDMILQAHGGDESSAEDFLFAASSAIEIVNNFSEQLKLVVGSDESS